MNILPNIFPKDKLSNEELVLLSEFYKEYFQKELNGSSQWIMLSYASFTSVFTVDYLYRLWMNLGQIKIYHKNSYKDAFIDQIAISDILNSNLVKVVNKGIYSIPTNIRWAFMQYLHHLTTQTENLNELASIKEIAHFLETYIQELQKDKSPLAHLISKEYEWTSLVYKTPNEALKKIGDRFENALVSENNEVNNLSLVNALNLSEQFIHHQELLGDTRGNGKSLELLKSYSNAWKSYMYKDDKIAKEQFKELVPYFKENISSKFYAPSIISKKIKTGQPESKQVSEKKIMIIVWKWLDLRISDEYLEDNKYFNYSNNILKGEGEFFKIYPVEDSKNTEEATIVATYIHYTEKTHTTLIQLVNHIYELYKNENPKIYLFLHRALSYNDRGIKAILTEAGNIINKAFLFSGGTDYIYSNSVGQGFLNSVGHFTNGDYFNEFDETRYIETTNKIIINSKKTEQLKQPYFDDVWEYYSNYFKSKLIELKESLLPELINFNQSSKNKSLLKHLEKNNSRLDLRIKSLLGNLKAENNYFLKRELEDLEKRDNRSYHFEDFIPNITHFENLKEEKIAQTYNELKKLLSDNLFNERAFSLDLNVIDNIRSLFNQMNELLSEEYQSSLFKVLVLSKSPLKSLQYLENDEISITIKHTLFPNQKKMFDLIIYDYDLNVSDYDIEKKKQRSVFLSLIKSIRLPIIVISDSTDASDALFFIENKADSYLMKSDFDIHVWRKKIKEIIELNKLRGAELHFISKSPIMEKIKKHLRTLAKKPNIRVLIEGETGVGKGLAVKYYQKYSNRVNKPFVSINLTTVNKELLESVLFGHLKGAFTGATANKDGVFKLANKGVLFLDNIDEINKETQVKLLRVLENMTITPIGSTKPEKIDVQIISATNKDLKRAVEEKTFRQDLYMRLTGHIINIPPLRERKEDIMPLIMHFAEIETEEELDELIDIRLSYYFMKYDWKGNVRELRTVISAIKQNGKKIENLPFQFKEFIKSEDKNIKLAKEELIKIDEALKNSNGSKRNAALELGIKNDQTLRYKVIKYCELYPEFVIQFPNIKTAYKKILNSNNINLNLSPKRLRDFFDDVSVFSDKERAEEELRKIDKALKNSNGSKTKAAISLGMSDQQLRYRIVKDYYPQYPELVTQFKSIEKVYQRNLLILDDNTLLASGVNLISKIFNKNEAVQEFREDFINATIEWIKPLFLIEDKKLADALDKGEFEAKLEPRLELCLEDLLEENEKFKKELEHFINEIEVNRIAPKKIIYDTSSLLGLGLNLITKVFDKNKALQEFSADFVDDIINWIRPWFLTEDKKLAEALEKQELGSKLKARLEFRLEDSLLEDKEFKKRLEGFILKMEENRHSPSTLNSRNNTVDNSYIIGNSSSIQINTYHRTPSPITLLKEDKSDGTPLLEQYNIKYIKTLLRKNSISSAIRIFDEWMESSEEFSNYQITATMLLASLNRLKKSIQTGTIGYDMAQVNITELNHTMFEMLNTLDAFEKELPVPKNLIKKDESILKQNSVNYIKRLISKSRLERAIRIFEEWMKSSEEFSDYQKKATLFLREWNNLNQSILQGRVEYNRAESSINELNYNILETLKEFKNEFGL